MGYYKSIGVGWGKRKIMASVGILWTINVDAAGNFFSSVKPTGKGAIEAKGELGEEVKVIGGDGEEQIRVYKLDGEKMVVTSNFTNAKSKAKNDVKTWTVVDGKLHVKFENVGQEKGQSMTQIYRRA